MSGSQIEFTLYVNKTSEVYDITQDVVNNARKIVKQEVQETANIQLEPNNQSQGAGSVFINKCVQVTQQGNIIGQWCLSFNIENGFDTNGNPLPEGMLVVNIPLRNTYYYNVQPPSVVIQQIETPLDLGANPVEYVPPGQSLAVFEGSVSSLESSGGYYCATGTVVETKYSSTNPPPGVDPNYLTYTFFVNLV
jgi:hypothetical protein